MRNPAFVDPRCYCFGGACLAENARVELFWLGRLVGPPQYGFSSKASWARGHWQRTRTCQRGKSNVCRMIHALSRCWIRPPRAEQRNGSHRIARIARAGVRNASHPQRAALGRYWRTGRGAGGLQRDLCRRQAHPAVAAARRSQPDQSLKACPAFDEASFRQPLDQIGFSQAPACNPGWATQRCGADAVAASPRWSRECLAGRQPTRPTEECSA